MSAATSSHRIRFAYLASDVYPREMTSEITEDLYQLSSPLCRGNARVESDGRLLHDGDVRPGMLRLALPGERVRTVVRSVSQTALLVFPGTELRRIFEAQGSRHRHGSMAYIDPLLQPSYPVEHLCTALLAATEIDRDQRQLFIDGLAHSLLACILGTASRRPFAGRSDDGDKLSDAELRRCIEYAHAMIGKRLESSDWAEVLDMPAAEFARRFQLKTEQAPYTWFMNWRVDHAKQLLRDRRLSVAHEPLGKERCAGSVFEQLQAEQLVRIKVEAFSLDSASVKVHPDGTGALKKTDHNPSANPARDGTPKFIWSPRMPVRR